MDEVHQAKVFFEEGSFAYVKAADYFQRVADNNLAG